jgi:hypothetical protein
MPPRLAIFAAADISLIFRHASFRFRAHADAIISPFHFDASPIFVIFADAAAPFRLRRRFHFAFAISLLRSSLTASAFSPDVAAAVELPSRPFV